MKGEEGQSAANGKYDACRNPIKEKIVSVIQDLIICPYCEVLSLKCFPSAKAQDGDRILYCNICKRWYPVKDGIMCILPDNLRLATEDEWFERHKGCLPNEIMNSIKESRQRVGERQKAADTGSAVDKRKEMAVRDEQARDYEIGKKAVRVEIEFEAIQREIGDMRDKVVFDIGCGVGKFVKRYETVYERLVGIDFSYESLSLLKKDLERVGNKKVVLLQADACFLPIRIDAADRVISSQMFQHLPGRKERKAFLDRMWSILKADGQIVMTMYNHSYEIRRAIAHGTSEEIRSKEDYHSDGKIFYHCFDDDELRALLEDQFEIRALYGLINQIPKVSYVFEKLRYYKPFDRLVQRMSFSKTFGLLLMASFQKRKEQATIVVEQS